MDDEIKVETIVDMMDEIKDGLCDKEIIDRIHLYFHRIIVTEKFLQFSRAAGNDLSTPLPQFNFPGLKAGDKWCLCALRWIEAYEAHCAPQLILTATHIKTLDIIPLNVLETFALDPK